MAAAARKQVLTDRTLKALKPAAGGKRYIVWDAVQPHLGVRVTDKGAKSFVVVKRRPGAAQPDTHVLGQYPARTLKAAREAAPAIIGLLEEGKSPKQMKADEARAEAKRRRDTLGVAIEAFIAHEEAKGLRSARETAAILRRQFLGQVSRRVKRTAACAGKAAEEWVTEWSNGPAPIWRDRPAYEIVRRDVVERLDQIKAADGKHAARHALSAIRKFFNWAAEGERFGIEQSPADRVRDKTIGISGRDLKRQRVLDDSELADVWHAADEMAYPFGRLVQLLILNGQRLNDNARAHQSEIDPGSKILTVPPERYKTEMAHEVPLTPKALELTRSLPKFNGYLFTTTGGKRPISGISKMKARLDALIAARRKKEGRSAMKPWVLHDLRRTVRTRLVSDVGIDAFIAERVIGHALPGLHSVYDQGSHRVQKREALERWEQRLFEIVEP